MRTSLRFASVVSFTALAVAGCSPSPAVRVSTRIVTVPSPSLADAVYGSGPAQPGLVYLPPSYDREVRRYPVVYYLPGFTTDVTEYIDGTFDGFHLGEAMDRAIAAGAAREALIVVVHARNFLGGSFYVNSPLTGGWEDYVVDDVVGWIDGEFRTLPEAEARGIAGESMGGFGALHLGMRHPELFGAVYSLSPGVFSPDGLEEQGILASENFGRATLIQEARMAAWKAGERQQRFRAFVAELYRSGSYFNYQRAFSYAYGAAFAADMDLPFPHIAHPFHQGPNGIEIAADRLARYEAGFGGLEEKLERHRDALRGMRALVIDVGENDRLTWIPQGCRYLSRRLHEAGIPHELRVHEGGHTDRLGERLEHHALPLLTGRLSAAREVSP